VSELSLSRSRVCVELIEMVQYPSAYSRIITPMRLIFASHDCAGFPDLYEASITQLQLGLTEGNFTSVELVKVSTV
jgi:hypothetical protein